MILEQLDFLYEQVGNNIRLARENKGISQEQLAKSVALSRTSIVNIEKGRQRISLHHLMEIAYKTDSEINKLLPGLDSFDLEVNSFNKTWSNEISRSSMGDSKTEINIKEFIKKNQ